MQDTLSTTPPESLPPLGIDISFSFIQLGTTIVWSVVDGWLLYFYLPPDGRGQALVPLAFYGIVVFAARIVNAFITPVIGYWSDHLHSRWGRRLPLMFGASLPLLIVFVLLWLPPIQGESILNLYYLGFLLIVISIAEALVIIPAGALLPEIAVADRHRVRLTMWSSIFQLLGVIVAGLAGLLIDRLGFVNMAFVYAIFILPLLYLPFLSLREQSGRQIDAHQRFGFLQSLLVTLDNRPFLNLTVAGVCFWTATTFLMMVIPYIVTEICGLVVADVPYFYIAGVIALLVFYPLVNWLTRHYGKWAVFAGSLFGSAVIFPLLMLVGPWFSVPLMFQGLIWFVLMSFAMSGVTMLPRAFAAEITDHDEKITGQRREGAYYSAWSLLGQVIGGVAAAILPLLFLFGRSQTDLNGPLGVRLIGLIGGGLMLLAFLIFLRYPLRGWARPIGQSGEDDGT